MPPDFLTRLFPIAGPWTPGYYSQDLWQLIYDLLNWDVVKGGLTFFMALMIGAYAIQRIKRSFN